MAKLVKLQISGIRSFGPYEEHVQQIKFATPLTLILGHNGCGKTTIIESIKYACTGELPAGASSGQGFVNDPKMSGAVSTKGQVKLKFLDPKDNEVTVCRVMEVVQTATQLKFTSKSASLRIVKPDGSDSSTSGRCVDITNECCQIMNVSPAILNNVVFCHQENSTWPLEEGKKLKEKFDEIFDAQKYNKCVDVLRKEWKERSDKIKILNLELKYTSEKSENVEKEKRELQEKEDKLQTIENVIRTKNEELEPVKQRIDKIFELEKVLSDLQLQLQTKKANKEGVIEEQNTIRSMSTEFGGTDEELQDAIKSFELDRKKDEDLILELEKRKSELENRGKMISSAIQEAQTQLGKYNQEKESHQKKRVQRKEFIERVVDEMNVNIFGDYDNNDDAKTALRELKTALESSELGLVALINEKEIEETDLQKKIDGARELRISVKQNLDSKLKNLRESEQKIAEISSELMSLNSSGENLNNLTRKIETIDNTLSKLNSQFRDTEESQKADSYKNDIRSKEQDLERLESEYKILQNNDVTEGKLESEKHFIMQKQQDVSRIKAKHFDNFKLLFGAAIPEKNLKDAVLKLQTNSDLMVKNLTNKINEKQKDITTLEVRRQNHMDKIATCEKDLKTKENQILQVCKGKNFTETLEETYQKKEKLQRDKGQYSSIKIIFEEFLKEFQKESPCCPVCETNFRGAGGAVKKIISTIKSKLEKVPQQLATVEEELKKEEALYGKLQQLKMVNDEIESLNNKKLPELKHCLSEFNEKLDCNLNEMRELKTKMQEPQKIVEISRNIISDVTSLDQCQSDIEKSKITIQNLEEDLIQVASNKSKQEIEMEIEVLKEEISEFRRKIDAQVKKINSHKDRIQQLTTERSNLIIKQMDMKESLQRKSMLEVQMEEMRKKIVKLKEEMTDLEPTLNLRDAELQSCIENKRVAVEKNKQEIQAERNKINTYNKLIQDIEKLQDEIDAYLHNQIDQKLESSQKELENYRKMENTLNDTKNKVMEAISKKKEELAKQQLTFQNLLNNVKLREKKVLETVLESEIQALQTRISGYNYRTVYEEKRDLMSQRENLEKQINNCLGQKDELSGVIEQVKKELAKPENKKAYDTYMSKFYELQIAQHIVEDLNNYIVALEKALLDFHKSQMQQINKNIRELWRDIYRGNDIDYIEIKTEYASGYAKRRSYNYKVVQVKKGIELDMRGRCSAGQKVLACLIIRIALAETLSSNCGILALDEPTTNLDRENIQSLCEALCRIVNVRQREKNFQLLVITHDEEFVETLTRVEGVAYYHRVLRNDEGFSVIKREQAI